MYAIWLKKRLYASIIDQVVMFVMFINIKIHEFIFKYLFVMYPVIFSISTSIFTFQISRNMCNDDDNFSDQRGPLRS